jgi:protein-tyrosine-phosphatase
MAEGILRHLAGGQIDVASAGNTPTTVNPMAVRVLADMGIDISQQRAKHLNEVLGQRFDFVIMLCDQAAETCPDFPGDPERIHWSFPDPAAVEGDDDARYQAFRQVATELMMRLRVTLTVLLRGKAPVS